MFKLKKISSILALLCLVSLSFSGCSGSKTGPTPEQVENGTVEGRSPARSEGESLTQVSPELVEIFRAIEEDDLEYYPRTSDRLVEVATEFPKQEWLDQDRDFLEERLQDTNFHAVFFALHLLGNRGVSGEAIEKKCLEVLDSEDSEMAFTSCILLLKKQHSVSALSPLALESLAKTFRGIVDPSSEQPKDHIQLVLQLFRQAHNDHEITVKSVLDHFEEILEVTDFDTSTEPHPSILSTLTVLGRARDGDVAKALTCIKIIEEKAPEQYQDKISDVRTTLNQAQ